MLQGSSVLLLESSPVVLCLLGFWWQVSSISLFRDGSGPYSLILRHSTLCGMITHLLPCRPCQGTLFLFGLCRDYHQGTNVSEFFSRGCQLGGSRNTRPVSTNKEHLRFLASPSSVQWNSHQPQVPLHEACHASCLLSSPNTSVFHCCHALEQVALKHDSTVSPA